MAGWSGVSLPIFKANPDFGISLLDFNCFVAILTETIHPFK